MGNTSDLAIVQKMIIDTLHKEDKSQRVITERCGCLQSAVSKHIKCKVDWKEEKWGTKMCTSNIDDRKLENYSQAKLIQSLWESFTRSELKLESVHQESPAQTSSGKGLPSHF